MYVQSVARKLQLSLVVVTKVGMVYRCPSIMKLLLLYVYNDYASTLIELPLTVQLYQFLRLAPQCIPKLSLSTI